MAEVLNSDEAAQLGLRGAKSKYPWSEWSDGQTWKITQGQDFEISPHSFCTQLYNRAGKIGKKVSCSVLGDQIVFRFHEDFR